MDAREEVDFQPDGVDETKLTVQDCALIWVAVDAVAGEVSLGTGVFDTCEELLMLAEEKLDAHETFAYDEAFNWPFDPDLCSIQCLPSTDLLVLWAAIDEVINQDWLEEATTTAKHYRSVVDVELRRRGLRPIPLDELEIEE